MGENTDLSQTMDKPIQQFINDIKKVNGTRKHKINKCYGIADYYKYYNSIRPGYKKYRIDYKTYIKIINAFHDKLVYNLFYNRHIALFDIGHLEIQKNKNVPKLIDGELVYNVPVDWKKTYELWYEYPEEKENKTLVKIQNKDNYFYRFKFYNRMYRYWNKYYIDFRPQRSLKMKLKDLIDREEFDCFERKE